LMSTAAARCFTGTMQECLHTGGLNVLIFRDRYQSHPGCTYLISRSTLACSDHPIKTSVSRQALSTVTISGVPMKPHDFHSHLYEDHSSLWQFFWDSWHFGRPFH
jgi:hypothetical protein